MTLSDIRGFLRERQHASIGEIAGHFGTDPSTMEARIDEWIRKGKVEKKAAAENAVRIVQQRICG